LLAYGVPAEWLADARSADEDSLKAGKAYVCAAMCKIIHIAFAILKSSKPFDPNYGLA
jgi:hypothetical protein